MSLWEKAQQLPQESLQQIRAIYGEHFPIEVRHYLSHWIEEKFWGMIEPQGDNTLYEQHVSTIINALLQEIENRAVVAVDDQDSFLVKLKLAEAAKYLRQTYSGSPQHLYTYIKQCLNTEVRLIQSFTGEVIIGFETLPPAHPGADIVHKIEIIRKRTQQTTEDLRQIEQEQESFALHYHECTKTNASIQQLSASTLGNQQRIDLQKFTKQKDYLESLLNQKVAQLIQLRLTLSDKLKESVQMLSNVQSKILDEDLITWKREQQLAGNGSNFNSNLDAIQEWCENLAEIIWMVRQQVKELERLKQKLPLEAPGFADTLAQTLSDVTQMLSTLVTSTFIIEKQPPQVMKTNTRFTATVRLLVGGKLNVHMSPPQVKVSIISETQANLLLKSDKLGKTGDQNGEILNNTGTMEYQQATRQLSASFRNMQLKKIKRAEKKGTESVMDEKFSLLFQSQFSVGGGELMFQVWTLSLPVVVIVHGNQEPHAWATITWDNAFADPGRQPFQVPDKVPWTRVAETLSLKFKALTGRGLTDENLRFLAEKAFRGNFTDNNQLLSWAQFCKEPLTERNFTFWEWFHAVMKLTREHLRGPWMDGFIVGFIRKKQAEEILTKSNNIGTFLLRFSDSELGGVTIAWVSDNSEILMLQPFTSKDFGIRSLADRISDLRDLVYLYPEVNKDAAFNKYYTPYQDNQQPTNGYVKPLLVTQIPNWNGQMSFPGTPQHAFLQSPDSRDTPSVASSYAGSVMTTTTAAATATGMDYLEQFEENIDLNGIVNLNELMQYRN